MWIPPNPSPTLLSLEFQTHSSPAPLAISTPVLLSHGRAALLWYFFYTSKPKVSITEHFAFPKGTNISSLPQMVKLFLPISQIISVTVSSSIYLSDLEISSHRAPPFTHSRSHPMHLIPMPSSAICKAFCSFLSLLVFSYTRCSSSFAWTSFFSAVSFATTWISPLYRVVSCLKCRQNDVIFWLKPDVEVKREPWKNFK